MSRRKMRESTFTFIFRYNFFQEVDINKEIEDYIEQNSFKGKDIEYFKKVSLGVYNYYKKIDDIIAKNAKGWKFNRIAKTDLTIMRLAIYENKFIDDVPMVIAINEALELSKKYGSEGSTAFINGILSKACLEPLE